MAKVDYVIKYPEGQNDIFVEYKTDRMFLSVNISDDGLLVISDSIVNGKNIEEKLFNTFEELCNHFNIKVTLDNWKTELGDSLCGYMAIYDNVCRSDSDVVNVITSDLGEGKHKSEVPPLNLSDETLKKQANYIAKAVAEHTDTEESTVEDEEKSVVNSKPYTLDDFNNIVQGIDAELLVKLLNIKGALLLVSPPGTGKTTTAIELAKLITKETNSSKVKFVGFNPSTEYPYIIGGYQNNPTSKSDRWVITKGSLSMICEEALQDKDNKYVYIIDEINRADTVNVLGEVMTAISQRDKAVKTNCGFDLIMPSNLYVIATMNSTDASVSRMDTALLDRFMIYNMPEIALDINKLDKPEELKDYIELVVQYLDDVNTLLETDKYKGKDNRIGNRALFENYNTKEELLLTLQYDIKSKIVLKLNNMDNDETKALILGKLKELEDLLKQE